jgi:uncharacterized membrane protein
MFGLTPLGIIHSVLGLVALITGFWTLARHKEITLGTQLGRVYLIATLLTALTALGIFQHGGFGKPHMLAVLTLIALAVGFAAGATSVLGRRGRYLQAICYTTTLLFHMIPGFAETLTRLPATQPNFPNADAPGLQPIFGTLFVLLVVGLVLQIRWLRGEVARASS